jgi:geranylgeranyl diphosphate synthase type I
MSVINKFSKRGKLVDDFMREMLNLSSSTVFYEVINHQILTGGKRIRPAMTIFSCEAVGGSTKSAIPAAAGIELLHNYTLIFDDIIDRSHLRRGYPTMRAAYGDVMALLAGMLYREVIFMASQHSVKSNHIDSLFSAVICNIIEGERLDVLYEQAGRDSEYVNNMIYRTVTETDYLRMIELKTASLFEAACKAGVIVGSGTKEQINALSNFGRCCGMAFQILDDVLDISGERDKFGKEIGKDIKEHKLGNIIILFSLEELQTDDRNELLSILKSSTVENPQVKSAIELIHKTNSFQRAYESASKYIEKAKLSLDPISSSHEKRMLLGLADSLLKREF